MNNDKKHVIPRDSYRRKRHEYFHNEEREERIAREKEERERLAEKEQQLVKVNEERVRDNLRKARIEKLTQEEIQQQQHEAKLRANSSNSSSKEENKDHNLTLPEEKRLKEENNKSTDSNQLKHHPDKENSTKEKESQPIYSRVNKNKEKDEQATENKDKTKKQKVETVYDNQTSHIDNNHEPHSVVNNKTTTKKKRKDNKKNNEENKKGEKHHHTNSSTQKVKQDKELKAQEGSNNESNTKKNIDSQKETTKSNNGNETMDKVKAFLQRHWIKIVIAIIILLLILVLNSILSNSKHNQNINQSDNNDKKYTTTMKIANSAVKSVVTVESNTPKNTSVQKTNINSNNELGSGVVYKTVGDTIFILTNTHIIDQSDDIKITYDDDKSTQATLVGKDKWSDIAVLKVKLKNSNMKPIHIGNSNHIVVGESILVIGNPLSNDFKNTVSKGIVSGINRLVPVDFDKDNNNDEVIKAFQIDAPVNPGNSGGAVVDKNGDLIGLASLKINMPSIEGMGFAIPINDAQAIANELEKHGKIEYPNTGIAIENVTELNSYDRKNLKLPNEINQGVIVKKIKDGGLGEKSGLKTDDVIVELDSKTLKDNLQYRQILFEHRQDLKTLSAKIFRDGKSQKIKIKLK
ncbi:S1C family serine protease [Staphylococcus sp. NRL 16/872]|uniref:S1C family serine protease n=1 Tax=Staphylococcus sp. NRL 16/872 TaxID=2930131 RepID=UPI001FB44215|nr:MULTISPECIES: S1C family serine protease [unclassified Staphylococcus]MCJ1656738.1 S1C family serine protease [Staphylococcus sp. NRL 21/187]MCJ1662490.1 S1C family serine protease [Staphylococcus sp. NRL 18/288]MCJ1668584.1 S1C family serine protease [Staphylococcus sp. NRL 19/737]WEN68801.1 S1C family serine protease [Staphylococcus sp. NRL 16/872]